MAQQYLDEAQLNILRNAGATDQDFTNTNGQYTLANPKYEPLVAQPKAPVIPNEPTPTGSTEQTQAIRYEPQPDPYGEKLKQRAEQQPMTYEQIREEERQRIQAQIDAIEAQWYSATLPGLEQESAQRFGQNIALQAASGTSASPRGVAQSERTTAYSRKIQSAERAKVDQQVLQLLDRSDQNARDRAEKAVTLARQDEQAYFTYLKDQRSETKDIMEQLAKSGATLDSIKANEQSYNSLLSNSGYDPATFDLLYNSMSPQGDAVEFKERTADGKLTIFYRKPDGSTYTKKYDWDYPDAPEIVNGLPYIRDEQGNLVLAENMAAQNNVADLMSKYPDAGIYFTDSLAQAQAKLQNSKLYQDDVRLVGKGSGNTTTTPDTDVPTVKLTQAQKNKLLVAFNAEQIDIIQQFVSENGLDSVLSDPGLSTAQKDAIKKAYGVESDYSVPNQNLAPLPKTNSPYVMPDAKNPFLR